ncbi:MAG: hypothetical protein ACO1OC_05420 [Tuberibacillus sp.]
MNDNKKMTSMLFRFSHAFLIIGFIIVFVSVILIGWNFNSIALLTGFGFVLASLFLYTITGALTALFSYETNLKAVHNRLNDQNVRTIWK